MTTTHTAIPYHICRRRIRQCAIGEKIAMPHNNNILVERRADRLFAIWHGTIRVEKALGRGIADINMAIDTVLNHPKLIKTEQVGVSSAPFLAWVELMTGQKAGCILKELNKTSWEEFGSETTARHAVRSLYVLRYGTPQASLRTLAELPLFAYALQQSA